MQMGCTDILFYYSGDHNWWIGSLGTNNQMLWTLVSNTPGFCNLLGGKHGFWTGDFNADGRTDILLYYSGDHNWWIGSLGTNNQMLWTLVSNTPGFGNLLGGRQGFWLGDFNKDKRIDILFYYQIDHNWWLGSLVPTIRCCGQMLESLILDGING